MPFIYKNKIYSQEKYDIHKTIVKHITKKFSKKITTFNVYIWLHKIILYQTSNMKTKHVLK